MIELINISKRYNTANKEILALDNVSIHVTKGSIYGIIGESGAGKSSLLRCVNLLERPNEGQVKVAGRELTVLSESELRTARQRIGMIFQHFNLLGSKTVWDNIALPLKFINKKEDEISQIIKPLIELTGLAGKETSYPHELSGGQKQRVAIARALATNPDVLLSDEATSALDPQTTQSILKLLQEINEKTGLTILLITHELEVIKTICDRVALMDRGKVLEAQDVIDFFAHPQTTLAKNIVENSLKMHVPAELKQELSDQSAVKKYPVVRIVFRGKLAREAVISMASRQFSIDISIVQSNIEFIGENAIGFLLAELRGEEEPIQQTLRFFSDKHLEYEVVGYVS
jgi:D-methionine transport system ATP-binding protein